MLANVDGVKGSMEMRTQGSIDLAKVPDVRKVLKEREVVTGMICKHTDRTMHTK